MNILTPERDENERLGSYWPVVHSDGHVTCSCGRELLKLDEGTFKCSGGWPIYRLSEGDIIKDKFGNIMMREIPH